MDIEKIEKLLNVKIVNIDEIGGKVFPLFDLVEIQGLRLALIKNPMFVVVDKDVYEKKAEGEYVVVQKGDKYLLMKYTGEPNVNLLRTSILSTENSNEEAEQEEDENEEQETEEETTKEDGEKRDIDENDPVKEILRKLPKWADGAVVIEREGVIVLPIKKSTKKDGYYASTSWKPLDISGNIDDLVGYVITKSGKVKANIHINDKYINIFIRRTPSRPRSYSRRR
jgi:hypothetical protein